MSFYISIAVTLSLLIFSPPCSFAASTLVFPQLVEGPGIRSCIVVMNTGSLEDAGQIEFFDATGQPLEFVIQGTAQSSIAYSLAPGGFTVVDVSGADALNSGYGLVRSSNPEAQLAGTLRISLKGEEVLLLDAPPQRETVIFLQQTDSTRTGLAIVNLASQESTVRLELLNSLGEVVAQRTLVLGAGEQSAQFADETFDGLTLPSQALLRVSSTQSFSLVGIRQDSDARLSSLPSSGLDGMGLPIPGPELFSGELALAHVEDQLTYGPRPTGSGELLKIGDQIQSKLRSLGWSTEQDLHTLDLGSLQVPVRNLVARQGQGSIVILAAHYDTRMQADSDSNPELRLEKVPGANDGASGVAVLLELARVISDHYLANNEIRLLFFDAEDNGNISPWNERPEALTGGWAIGSSLYAQGLDLESEDIQFMILVDMVGDMNQKFPQEAFSLASAPELVDSIWSTAASLGFEAVFLPQPGAAILDDHRPFIDRGIQAVDIIDLDYPFWHTTQDTLDKVSADSLERVGLVLQTFLMQRGVIERNAESVDQ